MERAKYVVGVVMAFSGFVVGLSTLAIHPLLDVLILLGAMALLLYSATGLFQLSERQQQIFRRK
jgi:hypothetical protein